MQCGRLHTPAIRPSGGVYMCDETKSRLKQQSLKRCPSKPGMTKPEDSDLSLRLDLAITRVRDMANDRVSLRFV